MRQARTGHNMVKSSNQNAPSIWLIFLCPRTHASLQTCHHSASSILTVRISCRIVAVYVFRKQQEEWRSWWISTIDLINKIFVLQVMCRYVHMIFIVKCVTVTRFCIAYAALCWKSMIFIVLSSLETTWYCTVQVLYFFHCSIVSWGLG